MKPRPTALLSKVFLTWAWWCGGLALLNLPAQAAIPPSLPAGAPEAEALRLSKILQPIPNDAWEKIAGEKISERYEIIKGDNLFDISKRLFGDGKYWPKIWSLNNDSITNPHLIRPGRKVVFLAGTGTSLPSVAIVNAEGGPSPTSTTNSAGSAEPTGQPHRPRVRSQEWKDLPHQSWETFEVLRPIEVDALGFDKNTKVQFRTTSDFDLEHIAVTERMDVHGTIIGSSHPGSQLTLGDTVYLQSQTNLQVGDLYSIVSEPQSLGGTEGHSGFAYEILGRVKITSVRDSLFAGVISNASYLISRGALLIPAIPRVKILEPIPGPDSVTGTLYVDPSLSTVQTAQHKQVFVDRGMEDGVLPGMIFRLYQHEDAATGDHLTDSDFIPVAEMIVIHSTPRFCTVEIIHSTVTISDGEKVRLLTNIADLKESRDKLRQLNLHPTKTDDVNELDKLEPTDAIGTQEKKELRQLEKWDGKTPMEGEAAPPEIPNSAPTGDEAAPPLPPEQGPTEPPTENPPAQAEPPTSGNEATPPTATPPAEAKEPTTPPAVATPDELPQAVPPKPSNDSPPPLPPEGGAEELPPPP